ncbi:hypothetical protein EYC84_008499 [Monilinia fructicola]|uniref:Uncharacterized protein n=1 Tax=Monilinia fructicola TaxID=38448 RepID=A0A5M9JHF7_MONFR|nr:hypothetical protein EYC84_008499 [Monilinia fructicola]
MILQLTLSSPVSSTVVLPYPDPDPDPQHDHHRNPTNRKPKPALNSINTNMKQPIAQNQTPYRTILY